MKARVLKKAGVILLSTALLAAGGSAASAEEVVVEEAADTAEVVLTDDADVDADLDIEEEDADDYEDDDYEETDTEAEEAMPEGVEDVAAEDEAGTEMVVISEPVSVEETVEEDVYDGALWHYSYTGTPNTYLPAICAWIDGYHMDKAPLETGMIPAFNIVRCVDDDRNDIRLYGHCLISDYQWIGQTLINVADEMLVGCVHLQQLNETDYVVSSVEVLDPGARISSAAVLTGGDKALESALLRGTVTREEREQAIRDFKAFTGMDADSWQDQSGNKYMLSGEAPSPDYVADLVEAEYTDEIITVGVTVGSNATLMFHKKQADGSWKCILDVPAYIGKEGLGKTREGDERTPVGTFRITETFGIEPDPGAKISYTQCDDTYCWVSDSASDRYNKLVSTAEYTAFDAEESEHIVEQGNALHYAASLSYNKEAVPFAGSAIFLHCFADRKVNTEGCVTVPEQAMVTILKEASDNARIIIDTEENLKTQHLNAKAKSAALQ